MKISISSVLLLLALAPNSLANERQGRERGLRSSKDATTHQDDKVSGADSKRKYGATKFRRVQSVPGTKIIDGVRAGRDEFPFFTEGYGCGASLIAKDVLLTAAHCAGGLGHPSYGNNLLINSWESFTVDSKNELIGQTSEHVHPNYNSQSSAFDVMLIKLDREVTNSNIETVPLAPSGYSFSNNQLLTVMGYGDTTGNADYSDELLKVDVNYISTSVCNSESAYDGDVKANSMFCAGIYPNGGKDSCQGDSGGPIVDQNGVQVGVVSWGTGCALANKPGVYASVPKTVDWIQSKACEIAQNPQNLAWSCGNTPTPPTPDPCNGSCGNCDQNLNSAGCTCSTCQQTVCAADAYCCNTRWDNLCQDAALEMCQCSGPTPPGPNPTNPPTSPPTSPPTNQPTNQPTSPPTPPCTGSLQLNNLSDGANGQKRGSFVVPQGATNVKFQISGYQGDPDLYVRFGQQPTATSYDCRPYTTAATETCETGNGLGNQPGTYHYMIDAYSAYSGLTLQVSSDGCNAANPTNPPTSPPTSPPTNAPTNAPTNPPTPQPLCGASCMTASNSCQDGCSSCGACQAAVCAQDDYCCTKTWDRTCSEMATISCANL